MQIVINISEKIYKYVQQIGSINMLDTQQVANVIFDGTPLPKEHGRLIDADALKTYIDDCDCCVGCEDENYGCADKCKCPDYLDEGMERIINNQPTIIEADKEVQE